jgi:hypothetical protein
MSPTENLLGERKSRGRALTEAGVGSFWGSTTAEFSIYEERSFCASAWRFNLRFFSPMIWMIFDEEKWFYGFVIALLLASFEARATNSRTRE